MKKLLLLKEMKKKKIMELYNQGLSEEEISAETGIGIGKVRITIDLYKRKK